MMTMMMKTKTKMTTTIRKRRGRSRKWCQAWTVTSDWKVHPRVHMVAQHYLLGAHELLQALAAHGLLLGHAAQQPVARPPS